MKVSSLYGARFFMNRGPANSTMNKYAVHNATGQRALSMKSQPFTRGSATSSINQVYVSVEVMMFL